MHQVEQASGGGDEDVDAFTETLYLGVLADAAKDDEGLQAGELAIIDKAFLDLDGQFAGRRQDERTDRAVAPLYEIGFTVLRQEL